MKFSKFSLFPQGCWSGVPIYICVVSGFPPFFGSHVRAHQTFWNPLHKSSWPPPRMIMTYAVQGTDSCVTVLSYHANEKTQLLSWPFGEWESEPAVKETKWNDCSTLHSPQKWWRLKWLRLLFVDRALIFCCSTHFSHSHSVQSDVIYFQVRYWDQLMHKWAGIEIASFKENLAWWNSYYPTPENRSAMTSWHPKASGPEVAGAI